MIKTCVLMFLLLSAGYTAAFSAVDLKTDNDACNYTPDNLTFNDGHDKGKTFVTTVIEFLAAPLFAFLLFKFRGQPRRLLIRPIIRGPPI